MSVDLSRVTGDPRKHYSRVVFEQGRPHLDADLNEQQEVSEYRVTTEAVDVIGESGAPKTGGGFQVTLINGQAGPDVAISAGRMYAGGILAELTPEWADVTVVAANQVAVPHRLEDGLEWQKGQSVEVGPQHQVLGVAQLTDVPGADLVLTLSAPVQGVNVNDVVRLRRQATLGLQPDLPTGALPQAAGRYRVYLDVWEQQITWLQDAGIREIALGGVDHAGRAKVRAQVRLELLGAAGNGTFGPQDCQNAFPDGWAPQGSAPSGTLTARIDPGSGGTGPCVLPPMAGFQGLENQLYRVQVHAGGDTSTDKPTFKWQRDNGSVATAIEAVSNDMATVHDTGRDDTLGFKATDTVEVSDDTSDLSNTPFATQSVLNVFTSTRQIQLTTPYPAVDTSRHAKLQRWDGTGSIAPPGWVTLEQGLQVQFAAGVYRRGDYWLVPARTATGSDPGIIEWPTDDTGAPLAQAPTGVQHHYAPLGLADFDGANFVGVLDCRLRFPPLTDITAGDVKFDDSTCQLPGVTTVQQAIDALCERTGGTCTLTARPGPGWETIFTLLTKNEDARICFPVGAYPLESAVVIADMGNLLLDGSGLGTRITSQGEAALVFHRCASVRVRDLSVTTGTVGAQEKTPTGHLNGALTFTDCPDVIVERVAAATPAATFQGASCLTLAFTNAQSPSSARIHSCDLMPGHQQIGALVVDCDRVSIEDCAVRAGAGLLVGEGLFQDLAFRHSVRSTLMQGGFIGKAVQAKAAAEGAEAAAAGGGVSRAPARGLVHGVPSRIDVGGIGITIHAPGALASAWPGLVQALQPQVATPRHMLQFVKGTVDRLLTDVEFRAQNPVFNDWIQGILRGLAASASAGIIIGGTKAPDVRVIDNSVVDAMRGIDVGLSGGEGKAAPRVSSGSVLISGNTIGVRLTADATRGRHGIFVGNSDSLVIENCHLTVTRAFANIAPVDGIRIWGTLGRLMLVRQNHVVGFTVGARVVPLAPLPTSPLWRVADNLLVGGLLAPGSVAQTSPAPGTPLNVS